MLHSLPRDCEVHQSQNHQAVHHRDASCDFSHAAAPKGPAMGTRILAPALGDDKAHEQNQYGHVEALGLIEFSARGVPIKAESSKSSCRWGLGELARRRRSRGRVSRV